MVNVFRCKRNVYRFESYLFLKTTKPIKSILRLGYATGWRQNEFMIEISNGRVFVNGKETINPELIGYAILDFAERQELNSEIIILKQPEEFIDLN